MKVNYHKWLEVEVVNNYFPKGICSVFDIIPLQKTARNLKNYNIVSNRKSNVYSFYIGTASQSAFDFKEDFRGLTDLYFQIIIDDPLFFNYTNVPDINPQQIFYFENRNNAEDATSLQQNEFVNGEDLMTFKPKAFTMQLPVGKVNLEVKKQDGTSVKKISVDGGKGINYLLNLNYQDDGIYELWLNNQLQETFFCSESLVDNCIGVLHFNINNLTSTNKNGLRHSLAFNARSVYWQYQIVVRDTRKIEVVDMSITGIYKEGYEGPVKQQIVGGQVAQVFTTTVPVRLQNKLETNPQLQMTYSNEFSNRKKELEIKLPNPDVEGLKIYNKEEHDNSFLLSTIVYV